MKAFRIHLEDGSDYVTSINSAVSDEEVEKYFVGNSFNIYGDEMTKVIRIEKI
jgi:hypothetical protein